MSVKIRLSRFGSKKRPSYRILVMDSRKAQHSRPIEQIGYYNPFEEVEKSSVNMDKLNYWMKCGAIPTERVALIIKKLKEKQVARTNNEAPKEKGGSET